MVSLRLTLCIVILGLSSTLKADVGRPSLEQLKTIFAINSYLEEVEESIQDVLIFRNHPKLSKAFRSLKVSFADLRRMLHAQDGDISIEDDAALIFKNPAGS